MQIRNKSKVPFTFRIDETCYAKLKVIAEYESRSISNMIEYLCKKEVERFESVNGIIEIDEEKLGLK